MFFAPDGRQAGEMTRCSFSSVKVVGKVSGCSPN
jgi:hypothetical protein